MDKKEKGERDLERLDQASRKDLKRTHENHRIQEQALQKHHRQEMAEIDQRGQQMTKDRRDKYISQENRQKEAHNQKMEHTKAEFQELRKRQHNHYHEKLDEDEQFFQDQIKNQRTEYTKRYNENERFNKAAYENQENRLAEELFKVTKDFITTKQFYDERKEDPFYSLVDFGANFQEGEAFYEVTAKVPEHEMKNVRVHVQPNKISLHASREHEQEFKRRNEKVGTNIAQTIRQEFDLAKPVEHEQAVKQFKDGILTVTVPKKGYYRFGMG